MNDLDLFIARTQRALSFLDRAFFAGTIIGLFVSTLLPKPFDEWLQNILLIMVGAMINQVTQQNQFWFMRQRALGVPDPTTTTVQTTETTTTLPSPAVTETGKETP